MDTVRVYHNYYDRKAIKSLDIIVVGASIARLTAGLAFARIGHRVPVLESVPNLSEVGAGIQIAPNTSRVLHRLWVLGEAMERASVLTNVSISYVELRSLCAYCFKDIINLLVITIPVQECKLMANKLTRRGRERRDLDDEEMSSSPLMPSLGYKYPALMSVIHRGGLHHTLLKAAREIGCRILISHAVTAVDSTFLPRVKVEWEGNGKTVWFRGDVVIGADGIKSVVRRQMVIASGHEDYPVPTGNAAYRLLIPKEKIEQDKALPEMMGKDVAVLYMGP